MLKNLGYSLVAVSVLMVSAGVVNCSFVSSVIAEDEDKDKEGKSDELMIGSVKTAFAAPVMSDDEEKDEKSGELMSDSVKTAFAGPIMSEDEDKDKEGKSDELTIGSLKTALAGTVMSDDDDDDEGKSGKLI